ncbi:conserved membrane hypothetical protein [Burkholderiales bacterium 8X]|nr:conserved membrane hypothetical protein [Burkholderiales bacterium 8X]
MARFAAAFWWGSLGTIGFLVVPMLFAKLGSPQIAGTLAGQLFHAQSWVSIGCALLLLVYFRSKSDPHIDAASRNSLGLVIAALLLALLQEYAVSPRILARENLKLWHGLGSAMYLGQWLLAGAVLWRLNDRR